MSRFWGRLCLQDHFFKRLEESGGFARCHSGNLSDEARYGPSKCRYSKRVYSGVDAKMNYKGLDLHNADIQSFSLSLLWRVYFIFNTAPSAVIRYLLCCRHTRENFRRVMQNRCLVLFFFLLLFPLVFFQDRRGLHIIMELCTGGDLFSRIQVEKNLVFISLTFFSKRKRKDKVYEERSHLESQAIHHYSEQEAAKLFCQCVQAIRHCHHLYVAHRDIKLDNFLLLTPEADSPVRLSDFGLSSFYQSGKVFFFLLVFIICV